MNLLELSEQEIIRRNSMEQLRQMGIEPYPAAEYVTNAFSKEIKELRSRRMSAAVCTLPDRRGKGEPELLGLGTERSVCL